MLIKEYQIVMPLSVSEYQRGQLYSTIKASKNESGGGEGIEIIENRHFDDIPLLNGKFHSGQYTYKIYHLEHKAPTFLKLIMPKGSLKLHEESWNAYPYCKTVLTNPGYMKENFILVIESIHLEGNTGELNALGLKTDRLNRREVVLIDIAGHISENDYRPNEDPTVYTSKKLQRGPLGPGWTKTHKPLMTAYKLVLIDCKWLGLQKRIERLIQGCEFRLFTVFHRQIFCWMDEWIDLSIDELKRLDEEAKEDLDKTRVTGNVRGLTGGNQESEDDVARN